MNERNRVLVIRALKVAAVEDRRGHGIVADILRKLAREVAVPSAGDGCCRCGCGETLPPGRRKWVDERHRRRRRR